MAEWTDIGSLAANVVMAVAAVYGVGTWRQQLRAGSRHSAAFEGTRAVYETVDVVRRSLKTFAAWHAMRYEDVIPETMPLRATRARDLEAAESAVKERYRLLGSARQNLRTVSFAIESAGGSEAVQAVSALHDFMTTLAHAYLIAAGLEDEEPRLTTGPPTSPSTIFEDLARGTTEPLVVKTEELANKAIKLLHQSWQ